jgi:hypothetical protein
MGRKRDIQQIEAIAREFKMGKAEHPKLRNLLKGNWQFGTRATPWLLKKSGQLLLNSEETETDDEIKNAKQLTKESLENKEILKFEVNPENLELQLLFESDYEWLFWV